jgi:hypothetical protein
MGQNNPIGLISQCALSSRAGIAVPKGNAGRLSFLTEFLSGIKRSGAMQRLVNEAGLHGVEVAEEK